MESIVTRLLALRRLVLAIAESFAWLPATLARFTVEFFRQPDSQLAEFARQTGLSMGQWLTIPLMIIGLALVINALIRPPLGTQAPKPAAA